MICVRDAILSLRGRDVINAGADVPPCVVVKREGRLEAFELQVQLFGDLIFEHEFERGALIHDDVNESVCLRVALLVESIHPELEFETSYRVVR